MKREVKKHLKNHHRKYVKFTLFFLIIVLASIAKELTIAYTAYHVFEWKALGTAFILSVIFTAAAELIENYVEKRLKR